MEQFFVQVRMVDGAEFNKLCSANEVIRMKNEDDFNGIEEMKVFDISEFGNPKALHFVGYQIQCRITFSDENGKVVIDGYGEDH